MRIAPAPAPGGGGRIIQGDTPWGVFDVRLDAAADGAGELRIIDANGHQVGTAKIIMRDPRKPLTPQQRLLAAARLAACERHKGVYEGPGAAPLTVKCGLCGCAGLSLVDGTCPADLWPAPGAGAGA